MNLPTERILNWMHEASDMALAAFKSVTGQRKADRSWVTKTDLEVEQFLIRQIRAAFPDHGILGEESGRHTGAGEYLWAIDPIDGTHSFVQGLPGWSISLGLLQHGQPIAGFVAIPCAADYYWNDAQGAFCNGNPIHVRTASYVGRGDWIALPSDALKLFHFAFPGKVRAFGSIAAHLCYVARDSAVAALLGGGGRGGLWDIAAGTAILRAAGGDLFTFDGQSLAIDALNPNLVEPHLVAASPTVVPQLIEMIRPQ